MYLKLVLVDLINYLIWEKGGKNKKWMKNMQIVFEKLFEWKKLFLYTLTQLHIKLRFDQDVLFTLDETNEA